MVRSSSAGRYGGSILIAVGVLQLVIGAGFVFALGSMPYAGGGMTLTGIVLLVVGVGLIVAGVTWFRRAADADRIGRTGIAGWGQITGLTQTGAMVNYQPVVQIDLLVSIPGRAPYPVSLRQAVPLIKLGSLQGSLPVKVDPARPDKVVIMWDQVGVGAMPPAAGYPQGYAAPAPGDAAPPAMIPGAPLAPGAASDETLAQVAAAMPAAAGAAPVFSQPGQGGLSVEQLRAQLRATGLAGLARVDQLQDSGQTVGDERLLTMTTTIFVPERIPYVSGPSAAMVPLAKVARVAVGVELPVRVAPDNPNLVMFEWDRI